MPHFTFIALLAVFFFAGSGDAHAQPAPSPAVKRILDKAVFEVKKNRQDFDKANEPALAEARKSIEALAKKLIEDGKADEAGAVLKQVGTLEVDVMRMANAPSPVPKPAPQQPDLRPILCRQKWRHGTHPLLYSFAMDGSYGLESSPRKGTYEIASNNNSTFIVLTWSKESNNGVPVEVIQVGNRLDNWKMGGLPFVPAK